MYMSTSSIMLYLSKSIDIHIFNKNASISVKIKMKRHLMRNFENIQ